MFKKRRPNDPTGAGPEEAPDAGGPQAASMPIPAAPNAAPGQLRIPSSPVPSGPTSPSRGDTGLGVPPFRPAMPPKEQPAMGRAPNQPPAPPSPAAMPPRPMPGATPGPRPARESAERRTLVVGRGISVQGTVQDAERLVVEGTVEATMISATELSIAPGGVFKGEVEVEDAEIAGTIDGTLTVRANLILRGTGKLLGTARYRRLQVEDGGQISGRLEMITGEARSAETEKVPAED